MRSFYRLLAVIALAAAVVSCDLLGGKKNRETLSVTLKSESAGKSEGQVGVVVKSSSPWTLHLDFSGAEKWATLSHTSGSGYKSNIRLSYGENTSGAARSVYVILETDDDAVECRFTQTAEGGTTVDGGSADAATCDWLELPRTKAGDGLTWYYHLMNVNGQYKRNYSFYWSQSDYLAIWVAYPLNSDLKGSGSRTNAWAFDPLLPVSDQPNIGGDGLTYRGYQRGHQLPSADRYAGNSNAQTFYATNMTPQLGSFNTGIWGDLENKVREWMPTASTDTMYVVTGCSVKGSTRTTTAGNSSTLLTVPTAYFKALLRYNRSIGYSGCAVWLDHFNPPSSLSGQLISIDALEEKLDIDLFVNLPAKVGEAKAAEIEAKAPQTAQWPL